MRHVTHVVNSYGKYERVQLNNVNKCIIAHVAVRSFGPL